MKSTSALLLVLALPSQAGTLSIQTQTLPDLIEPFVLPPMVVDKGFYPYHAPPGGYTQQQIDAALAGLAPMQKGILSSSTQHIDAGEELGSHTLIIDPNGALHGTDFTGNPLDHETWAVPGAGELQVDLRRQSRIKRLSRDFTIREYVRKPRTSGGATVDIDTWTWYTSTDLVETATPTLKYSPATVPGFIPASLVQQALSGATPGQEVPLASGYGVLPLGRGEGETVQTLHTYDIEFGTDYIGDPDDYLTWIAIGTESIQLSPHLVTEEGRRFQDQTTRYVLVVPDTNGQVILNPEIAVVTEVSDITRSWDKVYFRSGNVPPELDPADVAILDGKLQPGSSALSLHTVVETPGTLTKTTQSSIDAHGAVHNVDYSGTPSNPATWTALTESDVVVDQLSTTTLTTPVSAEHKVHMLYQEASGDSGETGQLHLVENNVVGRDIERVTRRYLNLPLDLENLPEGVTLAQVQAALAWAEPGEAIVAAQTRVRTLLSSETAPLPDLLDMNGWIFGTDVLGEQGDMNTWHTTGTADIYIDLYHRVTRTRNYEEVVINHILSAPLTAPPHAPVLTSSGSPGALHLAWSPPYGTETFVETSDNLSSFTPLPGIHKADGRPLRYSSYFPLSQTRGFLRVTTR